MYDRAPRTTFKPSGSTANGVGPGTYSPQDARRLKQSYAPFQSMVVRESFLTVSENLAVAPGPGHYTVGQKLGTDRGRGALHNKAGRFSPPSSKTPGPGAYIVSKQSDWIRKTYPPPREGVTHMTSFHNKDMLRVGHVTFHRQQTAPSIPMPGKNYGFEEDENGTLKPQILPKTDSTMGPAYYNVSYDDAQTTKKYKGVHFGNLKSDRVLFKRAESPGPRDYDPEHDPEVFPSDQPRSAQVRQDVVALLPRYHELITKIQEKKDVPGPGRYEIKSQFERKDTAEEVEDSYLTDAGTKKAPFGSRLQRFLTPKIWSPASTAYEDPRTAFESLKRVSGMHKAPFGQTSSRFSADRYFKYLPGPGAYDNSNVTSMTMELTKKAVIANLQSINCHPFGTTSVRTAPLVKKDEVYMPGPAHYQRNPQSEEPGPEGEEVIPSARVQRSKNSFMFSSTSKRLHSPPSIIKEVPPPGSYEVSDSYNKSQGKTGGNARIVNGQFLSTSDRFVPLGGLPLEEHGVSRPGPAEYDNHSTPMGSGKGGLICCKEDRFTQSKSSVPGPGSYEMSMVQRNTLMKGTYNVTLNNPLTPREKSSLQPSSASRKQPEFVL